MFVVWSITDGEEPSCKIFVAGSQAIAQAASEVAEGASRADVFEVTDAKSLLAAKKAVQMGQGKLVASKVRRATEQEINSQDKYLTIEQIVDKYF
ncbi:MAG: hypothetical protein JO273_05465 [Methylobacteriaceae bacterium]|nr:hypothetical protein [Methylobacteriaceae bacterium]